jgi:hypothetical protein
LGVKCREIVVLSVKFYELGVKCREVVIHSVKFPNFSVDRRTYDSLILSLRVKMVIQEYIPCSVHLSVGLLTVNNYIKVRL